MSLVTQSIHSWEKCLQGKWQCSADKNNSISSTVVNLDTLHSTAQSGNYQSLPQKRKHCVPDTGVNLRSKPQDTNPSNPSKNAWNSITQPPHSHRHPKWQAKRSMRRLVKLRIQALSAPGLRWPQTAHVTNQTHYLRDKQGTKLEQSPKQLKQPWKGQESQGLEWRMCWSRSRQWCQG